MGSVPDDYRDLFQRETYAHFSTVAPDGTPHVTPVWIDYADGHVLVNTEDTRRKVSNVRATPAVGVSMLDPDDPYRYLSIQGRVVEITTDGAVGHINELARRYMGVERYPNLDDEAGDRVILRVRPDRVLTG